MVLARVALNPLTSSSSYGGVGVAGTLARAILRTYTVKLMAAVADHRHNRWPKTPMFGIYIEQVEGRLGNRLRVPRGSWIVSCELRAAPSSRTARIFIADFYFIINSKSLRLRHVLNISKVYRTFRSLISLTGSLQAFHVSDV